MAMHGEVVQMRSMHVCKNKAQEEPSYVKTLLVKDRHSITRKENLNHRTR